MRFTRGRVRGWRNGHNPVTVQNRTHVYMNFFDHKDVGNHLPQLCPKVVKHPVYVKRYWGIFLELVNEWATFTCKIIGIQFSVYEFSPYSLHGTNYNCTLRDTYIIIWYATIHFYCTYIYTIFCVYNAIAFHTFLIISHSTISSTATQ
jgi:hypothetical protein